MPAVMTCSKTTLLPGWTTLTITRQSTTHTFTHSHIAQTLVFDQCLAEWPPRNTIRFYDHYKALKIQILSHLILCMKVHPKVCFRFAARTRACGFRWPSQVPDIASFRLIPLLITAFWLEWTQAYEAPFQGYSLPKINRKYSFTSCLQTLIRNHFSNTKKERPSTPHSGSWLR